MNDTPPKQRRFRCAAFHPYGLIDSRRFGEYPLSMTIKVILEPGEDGYIVAHCPALKSCWSQGRTREEALRNIREAVELYLEPQPGQLLENEKAEVVEIS
jgi:predicted RNase H-like HicB family nuclease